MSQDTLTQKSNGPFNLRSRTLTPEHVHAAYQLLLGRDPEGEEVVRKLLHRKTVTAMLRNFIASREFQSRMGEVKTRPAEFVPMNAPPLTIEWHATGAVADSLLAHVKRTWTRLGEEKPHRHVLGSQDFEPDRIDANKQRFFDSGAFDCRGLVGALARNGLAPAAFPRLFEFGCGVGRVTPHFARAFHHVTACDVAPSYLALARETIDAAGAHNVTLNLADAETFGMTAPFDLWFSRIVLQHNPPPLIAMIIRRALTLLAPGGIAVFQVPTYSKGYRFTVAKYLAGFAGEKKVEAEMHVLPQSAVFSIARDLGCELIEAWPDRSTGRSPAEMISTMFIMQKAKPSA